MALNVTRAEAERKGYTQEVFATATHHDLELLIIPGTDTSERFRAYDIGEEEWLTVNGWLFEVEEA